MLRHSRIAPESSDTLDYIQSMLAQLRVLAEREGYDMLAYLIDMAHLEANEARGAARPSRIRKDKRDSAA